MSPILAAGNRSSSARPFRLLLPAGSGLSLLGLRRAAGERVRATRLLCGHRTALVTDEVESPPTHDQTHHPVPLRKSPDNREERAICDEYSMSRIKKLLWSSRLPQDLGHLVHDARLAIGWSQRELGRRSGASQTAISRLERGLRSGLDLEQIQRIATALGGTLRVTFDAPFLADRARQRDRVHARCVAYVASRLRRLGWLVETEVEIDGSRGPGWIDVLAFHAASGTLLVIEIKTEIHDFGQIQRTLAWYERRAWSPARDRGWAVRRTHPALLLMATDSVDARLRDNRDLANQAFPGRASGLLALVNDPPGGLPVAPSLALIDPLSRRRDWLRPTRLDGRRGRAPHQDYASVVRKMNGHHARVRAS
jgi:transcriptional regulator with XRE-family HTH domain